MADGGGGWTALLGPGLGLACVVLTLATPAYLARIACRLARRAARVTSIGTGDVANSSSGPGCVGSVVLGEGALRGGFDSSILGSFLGDGEEPRKGGDILCVCMSKAEEGQRQMILTRPLPYRSRGSFADVMNHWMDAGETPEYVVVARQHAKNVFRDLRAYGRDTGRRLSWTCLVSRLVLAFHLFFGGPGPGPVVGCNLVDSDHLRYTAPAHHGIFQRYAHPSNLWIEHRETAFYVQCLRSHRGVALSLKRC